METLVLDTRSMILGSKGCNKLLWQSDEKKSSYNGSLALWSHRRECVLCLQLAQILQYVRIYVVTQRDVCHVLTELIINILTCFELACHEWLQSSDDFNWPGILLRTVQLSQETLSDAISIYIKRDTINCNSL